MCAGWWLSMAPEDSFLRRLSPLSELCRHFDKAERFGTFNNKTLGFLLVSSFRCSFHHEVIDNGSLFI